jgi:hypothetical protein
MSLKDTLIEIINEWSVEQITNYIEKLEERTTEIHELVRELKIIRKNKSRRKVAVFETGTRGGK